MQVKHDQESTDPLLHHSYELHGVIQNVQKTHQEPADNGRRFHNVYGHWTNKEFEDARYDKSPFELDVRFWGTHKDNQRYEAEFHVLRFQNIPGHVRY